MASIWFTGNYQDLSTDRGYQFRFNSRSAATATSRRSRPRLGLASSAIRAAGNLFGGILGNAANSAYEIQRAVGGPAHDAALKEAADEISKQFKQCTRCGKWVCEPVCWNRKMQLCETCAPDLDEELAAAQAGGERAGSHQGQRGGLGRAARRRHRDRGRVSVMRREDAGRQVLSGMRRCRFCKEALRQVRRGSRR
jgi:hypothetical protein